jgi:TNFR/NGFR cysteine-rich protein
MRGSILGLLLGGVSLSLACSSSSRVFAEKPSIGDAGAAGTASGAAGASSGAAGAATGRAGAPSGAAGAMIEADAGSSGAEADSTCSEQEYDAGASCKKLTICADKEFEKLAPTPQTDRVCGPLSSCGAGTFVSTEPTAVSDRACSPCEKGTFSSVLNALACAPWTACKSGESESVPPSATSDRICSTCGAGKYRVNEQCQPLTVCSASQFESTPPTAVSDRKCQALATCEPGSKQTAAPTTATDRQCAACSSGTFSTQVNASTCKAWTPCTASQTQSTPGSTTSDIVCVDKPVCSNAKDRTCTTQCPCASAEGVCTNSNQCVSGATCVGGSGKKVGRTGDTCLATHCNNDQLDSGESSTDCGGECGCRATLQILGFKTPTGTTFAQLNTMSRDGKRMGGTIGRGQTGYPAAIATDGTMTELESYGKGGIVSVSSADGSVLVGSMVCSNPPTCTQATGPTLTQWSGSTAPKVLAAGKIAVGMSSSGAVVTGDYYDTDSSSQMGYTFSSSQGFTSIPEFMSVAGLSPDARYVAGTLQNGVQGGVWLAQTQVVTKFGAADWTSITVRAVNGTDPAVVGFGYVESTDSYVGFRWKGGVISLLGALAGGAYSLPTAVSSDGSTVVGTTGSNAFKQAFIWTDKDKMRSIIDEVKSRGFEPAVDLELTDANFISDDGKTIVGLQYTEPPTFWRVVLE